MNSNLGRGATEAQVDKYWGEGDQRHTGGAWLCHDNCLDCYLYLDEQEEDDE